MKKFFIILIVILALLVVVNNVKKRKVANEEPSGPPAAPIANIVRLGDFVARDWSPDGSRLLVDKRDENGVNQMHTVRPDGSDLKLLSASSLPTDPPANCHKGFGHFHPSGEYVVMTVEMNFNCPKALSLPGLAASTNLWVLSVKSGKWTNLTKYPFPSGGQPVGALSPYFSHDGKRVVWAKLIGAAKPSDPHKSLGVFEIHLADFVTTGGPHLENDRALSLGNGSLYEPHGFSPDDKKILFSSDINISHSAGLDIWEYHIETGQLANLTNSPETYDEHAQYSPDGSKIAWGSTRCCSSYNKNRFAGTLRAESYLMNADGTNVQQMTHFNATGYPESTQARSSGWVTSFSPDGKKLTVAQQFYDGVGSARTRGVTWLVELAR